jgi:hypothetical protein
VAALTAEAGKEVAVVVAPLSTAKEVASSGSSSDNSSSGSSNSTASLSGDSSSDGEEEEEEEEATPVVPVGGTSGTAVVSAAKMVAAVAAATSISTKSSGQPSYRTLGDDVLAKEPGWVPASVLQHSEEEKEEVYSPGTSSGNLSGDGSCDKDEVVDQSGDNAAIMATIDEVSVHMNITNNFVSDFCF